MCESPQKNGLGSIGGFVWPANGLLGRKKEKKTKRNGGLVRRRGPEIWGDAGGGGTPKIENARKRETVPLRGGNTDDNGKGVTVGGLGLDVVTSLREELLKKVKPEAKKTKERDMGECTKKKIQGKGKKHKHVGVS